MLQDHHAVFSSHEVRAPRLALLSTEMLPVPPVRGGAVQTYISAVAPRLAKWFDVTVIGVADPELAEVEQVQNVTYVRVPEPHSRVYYENAIGFLESQTWDGVIVYNQPRATIWAAAAAPNAPIFLSMHNLMFEPELTPPEIALACLSKLAGVFTVSQYVADQSIRHYPAFCEVFHPVNAGVDLERFCKQKSSSPLPQRDLEEWLKTKDPVLITVARLVEGKGVHVLLKAMEVLVQEYPSLGLLVVGNSVFGKDEGSAYEERLRCQATTLGESVFFTGFIQNDVIDRVYAAADIFVCNSLWPEALARVHYEAMAAALPIVTTGRGGNPEVILPGENGFIYRPAESVSSLVDCLRPLIESPELRNRLGATGRSLAESKFGWDQTATRIQTILSRHVRGVQGVEVC